MGLPEMGRAGKPHRGAATEERPWGPRGHSARWPEMAEGRQVQVTAGRGKANFHTLPAQQGERSPESKSEGKPAKEHYNQLLKTSGKERIFNAPRGTRTSWQETLTQQPEMPALEGKVGPWL